MFRFPWNHHEAHSEKIQIHYIELLKHVMGSQTFTTNLCSQYICLCFLTIRSGYMFLDFKNIKTLLCVLLCFMWVCVYKMLLIRTIKTIITLQHYRVRYVLSSLCFGIALGEVFTVFGGLDCTVDVGTAQSKPPNKDMCIVNISLLWTFGIP